MNISAIIIVQSNHSKFVIIISLTRNATYNRYWIELRIIEKFKHNYINNYGLHNYSLIS